MRKAKDILSVEKYDAYLDPQTLAGNVQSLADFLTEQTPPFSVESLRPTFSYIVETDGLIATHSGKMQIAICKAFIHAFRLSVPDLPIDSDHMVHLNRVFHLLSLTIQALNTKEADDFSQLTEILKAANEIDFFVLPQDTTTRIELFNALIAVPLSDAKASIVKMLNSFDRFPLPLLHLLLDDIDPKGSTAEIIKSLSEAKKTELIQGIRTTLVGESVVSAYEKLTEILKIPPAFLFDSLRGELSNEDEKARLAAVRLCSKTLQSIELTSDNSGFLESIIARKRDASDSIRVEVAKLCCLMFSKSDSVWDCLKDLLVDRSADVRLAVVKGLRSLKKSEIKLDLEFIANRLRDKDAKVRVHCLKLMIGLYNKKPQKLLWLEPLVLSLYPSVKDVPLAAFEAFTLKRSLTEIMANMEDRKPLLAILRDTNEFRLNLPSYKDEIAQKILSRHIDLKELKHIMKSAPKNFLKAALDRKQRPKVARAMKEKLGADLSRLIMGLYQPSPIDSAEIPDISNEGIASELAKIYADMLEPELPKMIDRLSKVDLICLSKMGKIDIDDRKAVLKAVLTKVKSADREIALKAFARLFRSDDGDLLKKIKFKKSEGLLETQFFSRICDGTSIPTDILAGLDPESFNSGTVKYALRLASHLNGEKCFEFHTQLINQFPSQAFTSYLAVAHKYPADNTPEIFRRFASVIQDPDVDVRKKAIASLNQALANPETSIQFMALFALSASDPEKSNVAEAKKALEFHIQMRREIQKKASPPFSQQIQPESALPYLIHILGHHSDFPKDEAPLYPTFSTYMRFFLQPLCQGTANYDKIRELIWDIKCSDDIDEEYTSKDGTLCDIAWAIVMELSGKRKWDLSQHNDSVLLPSKYFKPAANPERVREELVKSVVDSVASPAIKSSKRKLLSAGMSPARSPKRRALTLEDLPDEVKSASVTPKRIAKKVKPKKADKKRSGSAKGTPKRETKTVKRKPKRSLSAASTPKRTTKKASKRSHSPTLSDLKQN